MNKKANNAEAVKTVAVQPMFSEEEVNAFCDAIEADKDWQNKLKEIYKGGFDLTSNLALLAGKSMEEAKERLVEMCIA